MPELIYLQSDGYALTLIPELGGLIASLAYAEVDVLRPLTPGSFDPLSSASFPLVPFANRIAGGRFSWNGSRVRLPANFPGETSAIHGFGWQNRWRLLEASRSQCILSHEWRGMERHPWPPEVAAWPWSYRAEQHISVGDDGCSVKLTLINCSDNAMPAGLGLHPYFRRRPETCLTFSARHVYLMGSQYLPDGRLAPASHFADFASGANLPEGTIDHCFAQWGNVATLQDDIGTMTLTASGSRHLHLYAPSDPETLCLEPVSHMPDAINKHADEMLSLQPGEETSLTMHISAQLA